MFLGNDEHVIVMNTSDPAWGVPLTTEDFKRLKGECGINVIHDYADWSKTERGVAGSRNWTYVDRIVQDVRDAGMKLILYSPITVPGRLKPELYGRYINGRVYREVLSFWSMESRSLQTSWLQALIDRYSGDDVTIAYAGLIGEHYLWNSPVYLDSAARATWQNTFGSGENMKAHAAAKTMSPQLEQFLTDGVVDHLCAMQDVLVKQHGEVWDTTQLNIGSQSHHNAVFARPAVMAAYKERYPNADRFLLQYTYWAHGHPNAVVVDSLLEDHGFQMIVEAEYCEGLKAKDHNTATEAVKGGHFHKNPHLWRGMIICPLHLFREHKTLEPWMMDAMKRAVDTWREAKN